MIDWEAFYSALRQPEFLPGYEILNHLGGGAFGEVYKARKTSIGKSYAIKFLKLEDDAQNAAIERELEQVRLFASIDHPNLVTIEDMGVVQGVPYLLMGYAGEDTLARHLKRRELDRGQALRTFVQICRGVVALHERRLAHFDLKPGNVFLHGEVARVGDYGLAKLLTEGRQTLSFGRGTPAYMAPEMLRNRADHRADIYSLGVILYESLTFRLPYEPAGGYGVVVRDSDLPPAFPPDFPPGLRPVVERCLRLEPGDRYATVRELLAALGQTARPGDSVRIDVAGLEPAGVPLAPPLPAPAARSEPGSTTTQDLRRAAAELARGAIGVAVGVWDGVRGRVTGTGSPPPASSRGPGAAPAAESEVVSLRTLDEPDPPGDGRGGPVTRYVPRDAAPGPEPRGSGRAAARAVEGAGTVPVPPAAEGGLVGTVSAAVVLGAEILGALLSGPVLLAIRGAGDVVDRAARGVPGFLGGLVRLLLLILLFALLGGLIAFLVLSTIALDFG
ncbi:MAG: protein kinase [Planctomycetota bacterium]